MLRLYIDIISFNFLKKYTPKVLTNSRLRGQHKDNKIFLTLKSRTQVQFNTLKDEGFAFHLLWHHIVHSIQEIPQIFIEKMS